jgi:DNA helicase-2/ATP-dependent DNA helicase PcrA
MIKEAGRDPNAKATLQRAVDLIVFEMGVAAYREWLLSVGQDPDSDGHALKAELLMVRYREPIKDMFESHLQQFTELPSGGLLQRTYRQASRAGNIKERFDARVEFYKRFARWGMAHRQDINDVFKRKSRRIMREVLQVADDEQPALVVNKLASLQTVSGLNQTRNWLKKAAVLCGEEVDPVTEAVADTESAKTVAEEVRDIDRKISVEDPVSDEAADLAFEREDAINTLNETVASAKDSEAALTNAVDVITNSELPSWVREYGLNDEQMRVLLADGKLIVNAGAGSGKTHTLVAKIGYAVRELGMTPDQILAVSFTKLSSEELKERVKSKFGLEEKSIGQTMNSLSYNALLREGTRAEALRVRNFDLGKKSLLENYAYRQLSLSTDDEGDKPYYSKKKQQWVEPNPSFRYQKRGLGIDAPELAWIHDVELPKDGQGKPVSNKVLLNMLGKWHAQGLLSEDIVRLYKDSDIPEERCAAAMSAAYSWLKENDVRGPMFDYNDMQIRFRDKLRDDDRFRARYQSKFKMVLVDEAQDTNAVQHEIFDVLGEKSDILAYIGDDRQSIYKFRGADPKLYIDKARSNFRELRMELNYRSGSNIVNAGENLIAYNGDRQLPKTCRAVESSGDGRIVYTRPDTHQAAAKDVVSEIRSKLKTGEYEPRDFGIVTRTNAEKDAFIVALIAAGIPFETKGGFNFFGKDIVKGVIAWTRIAVERGNKANLALKDVLKTPNFKLLGEKFVWKAKAMAEKEGYTDICEYLATEDPLVYKAGVDSQKSVEALGAAIREIRSMGTNSFPALLERILTLKGTDDMGGGPMSFLDQLVSKMNIDELQEKGEISSSNISREELEEIAKAPLNPLLSIAEARPGVEAFLSVVDMLSSKEADAKAKEDDVRKTGRVNVNTCHQWKGLEAQELYVLMAGGVWPHARSEDLDEERRLAYVGITRGKQSVKVLAPDINYRNQPAKMSPFIGEACIKSEDEDFLTRQSSLRFAKFVEENPFGNFIVDMVLDLGEEE